jgi:hypothetical protein
MRGKFPSPLPAAELEGSPELAQTDEDNMQPKDLARIIIDRLKSGGHHFA